MGFLPFLREQPKNRMGPFLIEVFNSVKNGIGPFLKCCFELAHRVSNPIAAWILCARAQRSKNRFKGVFRPRGVFGCSAFWYVKYDGRAYKWEYLALWEKEQQLACVCWHFLYKICLCAEKFCRISF